MPEPQPHTTGARSNMTQRQHIALGLQDGEANRRPEGGRGHAQLRKAFRQGRGVLLWVGSVRSGEPSQQAGWADAVGLLPHANNGGKLPMFHDCGLSITHTYHWLRSVLVHRLAIC